jgi:hypothetical protein
MNAAPESITRHELTAALIHLEHSGDKPRCDSCWDKAGSILDHIEAHREPEYEPGEIYEDAEEVRYLRLGSESFPWLLLGRNGVPVPNLAGAPATPLRKLVPEGPQSAKPSHFDVLAEIVTGLGRDETDKQLADRICMLMGASDEH